MHLVNARTRDKEVKNIDNVFLSEQHSFISNCKRFKHSLLEFEKRLVIHYTSTYTRTSVWSDFNKANCWVL